MRRDSREAKQHIVARFREFVDADDSNGHQILAGACFRYNTNTHSETGVTPFKTTFVLEALDFDPELGLRMKLDDRDIGDLPRQMKPLHDEIFIRTKAVRLTAEKYYNKAVAERTYV